MLIRSAASLVLGLPFTSMQGYGYCASFIGLVVFQRTTNLVSLKGTHKEVWSSGRSYTTNKAILTYLNAKKMGFTEFAKLIVAPLAPIAILYYAKFTLSVFRNLPLTPAFPAVIALLHTFFAIAFSVLYGKISVSRDGVIGSSKQTASWTSTLFSVTASASLVCFLYSLLGLEVGVFYTLALIVPIIVLSVSALENPQSTEDYSAMDLITAIGVIIVGHKSNLRFILLGVLGCFGDTGVSLSLKNDIHHKHPGLIGLIIPIGTVIALEMNCFTWQYFSLAMVHAVLASALLAFLAHYRSYFEVSRSFN